MSTPKRKELEEAIIIIETHRSILGDKVVDSAIYALKKQLNEDIGMDQQPKHQRKLITVLFMDVVNSTSFLRKIDPEESISIMDTALQQLSVPVKSYGGRVTRFMGDGFLGIFGLQLARENDPEMAVRAGLEILKIAKNIASILENEKNLGNFQVRVGINTGLVVTGGITEGENTVMGNAVNLASRLESLASLGGLLISQYTYQHVHGLFNVEPSETINVKGFIEPIQVYMVKTAKPSSFRMVTRGIEGISISMIGREKELNDLKKSVESIKLGNNRFITIVGEAGLGKSRLLYEFENWLNLQSINFDLLKGRSTLEIMRTPYGLLRNIFSLRFGIMDDDPITIVRSKVIRGFKNIFGEGKNQEINATIIGQLLGYDFRDNLHIQNILANPKQLHDRAFVQLVSYMKQLAIENPVIVFLDDIHWADESSLDLIQHMASEISDQQILFIALSRPSLFERRPAWGNDKFHHLINLYPLSSKESQQMVREVLQKVENIPDKLSELIVSNVDGNPYYLEETVKMLLEDEIIVRGKDHWSIIPERLTDLHIPATLSGVLQSRLDHLPETDRTILQQAAVVGRVFWDAIIVHINESTNILKETNIEEVLTALNDRELILKRESSTFSNVVEYRFKHTILREVTYETVLIRIRQVYHEQVANWLIKNSGERIDEVASQIAGHFEKAGKKKDALNYLTKAAEAALSNYAMEEAEKLYTRALTLTSEDDFENQYVLLMGKEKLFGMKGTRSTQRELLESLTKLVEKSGDNHKKVEVLIRKAWFAFWTSMHSEMLLESEKAVNLAQMINNKSLIQQAIYTKSWALLQLGDSNNALKNAGDALFLAQQLKDRRGEGNILNAMGNIKISQGDFYNALNYLEGFLSIARDINDQDREMIALNNLGVAHTRLGKLKSANDYYHQFYNIAKEINDKNSIGTSMINIAWVLSIQQEWEKTIECVEEGINVKREVEHPEAIAEGLVWLGHSWLGLDNPKKAIKAYNEALNIRKQLNQTSLALEALAGLARVALKQNDLQSSQEFNEEIVTYLTDDGTLEGTWEPLRIYLTSIQVLQVLDDPRAEKILKKAYQLLQYDLSRIPDEADRKIFLEDIPWHREILKLWRVKNGDNS